MQKKISSGELGFFRRKYSSRKEKVIDDEHASTIDTMIELMHKRLSENERAVSNIKGVFVMEWIRSRGV